MTDEIKDAPWIGLCGEEYEERISRYDEEGDD